MPSGASGCALRGGGYVSRRERHGKPLAGMTRPLGFSAVGPDLELRPRVHYYFIIVLFFLQLIFSGLPDIARLT